MSDKAIIAGWLYLPLSVIGERQASLLRMQLQFLSPFAEGEIVTNDDGHEMQLPPVPMKLYADDMPGYLGVPRTWGLNHYPHFEMEDRRTFGERITVAKRPNPNHPRVLDPAAQSKFMTDLRAGLLQYGGLTAMAATGSGKTVVALDTAAELGYRTLILVHLNRLLRQWVGEIKDKLGVPASRIGIAQQDKCQWRGKDFVVGMLHSVAQRDYEPAFYDAFGLVINDECHKTGNEFFAPALTKFNSYYRLNLSATPKRKDRGEKVFFMHGGPIRVVSNAAALPIRVYVRPYHSATDLWGNTKGSRVKCLTKDQVRNTMIAQIIRQFWMNDRQALVISDSVMHLQHLMSMAAAVGVPHSCMGQFTGEVHRMEQGPDGKMVLKKTKQTNEALDVIQAESQIIFATYGMMTEGIDIPRLDAGVDATPRSDAIQLIGRIRRPVPGKRMPIWVTLLDMRCSMSKRWFQGRLKDYHATKAEVVYHGAQASGVDGSTVGRTAGAVLGGRSQPQAADSVSQRPRISRRLDPAGARIIPSQA